MLDIEKHIKERKTELSLKQLKEKLPRTPYDKANWLEEAFLKERDNIDYK